MTGAGVAVETPAVASQRYYREVAPAPPLRLFVECLWVHFIPDASADGDRRILPDGRMDLVWIRGLGTVVAGPQTQFTTRPMSAPMLAFGARFHPGTAPTLLRVPVVELLDDHVPLQALDLRWAQRLDDALSAATDDHAAFEVLNRELTVLLDRLHPDPLVSETVPLLAEPSATVAEVSRRAHTSERQIERRFVEHVGYAPKTLQRILRLQSAVRQIESLGADVELARLAASAGYSDQSHLSRESRRLAGLTPGQLVRWIG